MSRLKIDIECSAAEGVQVWEYLKDEDKSKLIEAAQRVFGSYWSMSLSDFLECQKGDFSCIGIGKRGECTVFAQYVWATGFAPFVESFVKTMKSLEVKQSGDEKRASASCLPLSFEEASIVFLQSYFGLHSFDEALRISLADYIIAKKSAYNKAIFERRMAEIQRQRLKTSAK